MLTLSAVDKHRHHCSQKSVTREKKKSQPSLLLLLWWFTGSSLCNWGRRRGWRVAGGQYRVSCPNAPTPPTSRTKKKKKKENSAPSFTFLFWTPETCSNFSHLVDFAAVRECVCVCVYYVHLGGEPSPGCMEVDETTTWAKNKRHIFPTARVRAGLQGRSSRA